MDSPAPLRTVDEHARRAVALVAPLPAIELPLDEVVGAVLARDLVALLDLPPFDAAAMDGYALRRADAAAATETVTLQVVGEVAAGSAWDGVVGAGQTVRIMTGAPLPEGADVVVPVERTSTGTFAPEDARGVGVGAGLEARTDATGRAPTDDDADADVVVPALTSDDRTHVRLRGEDVTAGTVVASAGTVVSARLAALAAALGHATLPVHRPPVVAVLSTGDELTPAGAPLTPGRIPDSNSVLIAGAVRSAGARAIRTGGVPDAPGALAAALDDAVRAGADLLVTTGGVSVGAHDVVRTLLAVAPRDSAPRDSAPRDEAGATDVDVAAVGMQPGKPQALARWRGVPWVAAPGNPTGAYASFELFVRPMLARLRGLGGPGSAGEGRGAVDESRVVAVGWRSPSDRQQLVPVRVDDDGRVAPVGDGHRLSALALADGLAVVPAGAREVRVGDEVVVRRFAPAAETSPVAGGATGPGGRTDPGVFDAVVLAGGRAERLGTPKPGLVVGGRTLLDRALAAASGARSVVVVGPAEAAGVPGFSGEPPLAVPVEVPVVREHPPFGGPVAGIAAGLDALGPEPSAWVLVLACDVPRVADAVPLLVGALAAPSSTVLSEPGPGIPGPGSDNPDARGLDGAFLVRGGRAQWLVGLYRREPLERALDALRDAAGSVHGAPVKRLVAPLHCLEVDDPAGLSDDVDTWDDAERLDRALTDEPDRPDGPARTTSHRPRRSS